MSAGSTLQRASRPSPLGSRGSAPGRLAAFAARPRAWLARLRPLAERASSHLAPTALGWVVGVLSGLALWWYGLGTLDLLLFVIGICGLALLALSCVLVLATSAFLRSSAAHARTAVARIEAASPIRTGFDLPGLARLPLVQLRWEWLRPAGVEVRSRRSEGRLLEEVVAQRRTEEASILRRIYVESAFGLAQVWWDVEETRPVTILPSAGRLHRSAVIHSLASADGTPHPSGAPEGDRMEIRRYTAGDSARHILWARYAKTRELVVRTPERSVDRTRRIVAYLVSGPEDEPAAAAARLALESGALGDSWLFGADGSREPRSDLPGALDAIARSGSAAGRAEPGLGAFLERVDAQNSMHCIVYAPGLPGAWTLPVLEVLRRRAGRISFVLGVDGVAQPQASPLWRRLLFREPRAPGAPPELLSRVSDMLVRSGGSVVVADRHSGRYYGELRSPLAPRYGGGERRGGRA